MAATSEHFEHIAEAMAEMKHPLAEARSLWQRASSEDATAEEVWNCIGWMDDVESSAHQIIEALTLLRAQLPKRRYPGMEKLTAA